MFKLGRDTGSLVNYVQGNSKSVTPEAGMGATILGWSDRHAATIVSVDKYRGRVRVGIQQDNSVRTDKNGMSESQDYSFTANPDKWITGNLAQKTITGRNDRTHVVDTSPFDPEADCFCLVGRFARELGPLPEERRQELDGNYEAGYQEVHEAINTNEEPMWALNDRTGRLVEEGELTAEVAIKEKLIPGFTEQLHALTIL